MLSRSFSWKLGNGIFALMLGFAVLFGGCKKKEEAPPMQPPAEAPAPAPEQAPPADTAQPAPAEPAK